MPNASRFSPNLPMYLCVILLLLVTVIGLLPFATAFFGAGILYILFNPLYHRFLKIKLNRGLSATAIIIVTLLFIVIPIVSMGIVMATHAQLLLTWARELYIQAASYHIPSPYLELVHQFNIKDTLLNGLHSGGSLAANAVVSFAGNIGHAVLAIFVMEVLLYFLLTSQENFFAGVSRYWPSRPEYLTVISREISSITRSVVISTALIALIQTLIMTLAFWLIGLPQVALLAGLTFILSLLPFVGAPVVWGSIAVFQFFSGHLDTMVILTIVGLGVSTIDNFLRPYFQRKFGEMHPLTSLVGVILGVPIFGFIGLFIGPIILTLTIELTKISLLEFKSE